MNKQRIAILIIASFGIIATFMPWSTLPVLGSMHGTDTKLGWVSLSLFSIPLILGLIGNKNIEMKKWSLYAATVLSVLAILVCLFQIYIFKSLASRAQGPLESLFADNLSIGFGLYIAILSGMALPVFGFLMRDSNLKPLKKKSPQKTYKKFTKEMDKSEEKKEEIIDIERVENKIDKEDHSRFMPK